MLERGDHRLDRRGLEQLRGLPILDDELAEGAAAAREVGAFTEVVSATAAGSRYANFATNLTAREFQANLLSNGYRVLRQTMGSNGPVTILTNREKTYTIYTGCSSEVCEWCIYCERSNDMAVLAIRRGVSTERYIPVIAQFKAVRLAEALKQPLAYGFSPQALSEAWRRKLLVEYASRR
ncbi:MAG TPA: hypothetical protein VF329_02070 [Gammaproteobacteria bacterium]